MSGPGSRTGWRPRAGVGVARRRAVMLAAMRDYFARQGVLEVDVAMISPAAVSDPNIESVEVRLSLDGGRAAWLHTSPEFAMKRLLAAGFPDIYYAGRVFRDGEAGRRHQPEFTMVEWYRSGYGLDAIIADTEAFLEHLLDAGLLHAPPERLAYRQAFRQYLGIDPFEADIAALAKLAGADASLEAAIGDERNAWLDLLLARRVAPQFSTTRLTTLYHYPATQAALARLAGSDAGVAERFEVFVGELELANGYVELTDAAELGRRFAADQARRRRNGRAERPIDRRLLAACEAGLPDCAGVAAGFDRLLMLNTGTDDLRDVQHFCREPGREH